MMKKHFITYADRNFANARQRIVREAENTKEFDIVKCYSPDDVSEELKAASIFHKARGGGYWSWKPDIIVSELSKMAYGDILVYVDSGCEVVAGREWKRYWKLLQDRDLIAQRIYQRTDVWSRLSIIREFSDNPNGWTKKCQFMATVVFAKKTLQSEAFFSQWREYMIKRSDLVLDVDFLDRSMEYSGFIENRHDQSVFSALIYRSMKSGSVRFVADVWEHVENQSPFGSQVIRAMRWNSSSPIPIRRRIREMVLRVCKDLLLRPIYKIKDL